MKRAGCVDVKNDDPDIGEEEVIVFKFRVKEGDRGLVRSETPNQTAASIEDCNRTKDHLDDEIEKLKVSIQNDKEEISKIKKDVPQHNDIQKLLKLQQRMDTSTKGLGKKTATAEFTAMLAKFNVKYTDKGIDNFHLYEGCEKKESELTMQEQALKDMNEVFDIIGANENDQGKIKTVDPQAFIESTVSDEKWCQSCCKILYNFKIVQNSESSYGIVHPKSCLNKQSLSFSRILGKYATKKKCANNCKKVDFRSSLEKLGARLSGYDCEIDRGEIVKPGVGLGTCKSKTNLRHSEFCIPTCTRRGAVPSKIKCDNGHIDYNSFKCISPSDNFMDFNVDATTGSITVRSVSMNAKETFVDESGQINKLLDPSTILFIGQPANIYYVQYIQDSRYGSESLMSVPKMGKENFFLTLDSLILRKLDFKIIFSKKPGSCVIPKDDQVTNNKRETIAIDKTMYECPQYIGTCKKTR